MRNQDKPAPHVFFFDIDGTLLASGGAGKIALEEALLAEFGLDAVRLQVPYSGRTDVAIARDLLLGHGLDSSEEKVDRLHQAYLNRLPQALQSKQGRILPGVSELLRELQTREDTALIGLLTGNIRRGAQVKLGHFGIEGYFAFGGFGDGADDRDEVARRAWQSAQEHYGGQLVPQRSYVIGDTPLDVACARAIGAKAIAVATGLHSTADLARSKPDLLLESLAEFRQVMELMEGS